MRTRTKGIQLLEDGERSVDKQYHGQRIYERLGKVSQEDAEAWLRQREAQIDASRTDKLREGDEQLFAAAAAKYLTECQQRQVRSLQTISYHVQILRDVCNDSLEAFKDDRVADDKVKNVTVNRSLEVVRTVLNRAARVWRMNGKPWLSSSPLIEMLDKSAQDRPPRPISWDEQANLGARLPAHLQRMVLYTVNTGARDDNVCGLRWAWEVPVPEIGRSVFVIPPQHYKANRPLVQILNDVAWSVVRECRGMHEDYVFALPPGTREEHRREAGHAIRPDRDDEQHRVPDCPQGSRLDGGSRARPSPHVRAAIAGGRCASGRPRAAVGTCDRGHASALRDGDDRSLGRLGQQGDRNARSRDLLRVING
jgi:integrase